MEDDHGLTTQRQYKGVGGFVVVCRLLWFRNYPDNKWLSRRFNLHPFPHLLFWGWREDAWFYYEQGVKPSSHCFPPTSEQNCHHNQHIPSPLCPAACSDWKRRIPSLHARVLPPSSPAVHSNVPLGVFMGQPTGCSAHWEIKGFPAQINVV